jgi:RNA polymerase sigma-70 factor, ECF subfamily
MRAMDPASRALAGVARGDEGAFDDLYDLLAPKLMAFALHLTRNREDAEEVVQDTFVLLCRHAGRFDPRLGEAGPYAYAITRNLVRSRWRAEGSRPNVVDLDLEPASTFVATDPLPARDDRIMVSHALAALDPLDRALVDAAFLAGLSHVEVARRFGMPLGTVKSRLRRALMRLRQRWTGS